jgi:DNA replication and repair protein RecF
MTLSNLLLRNFRSYREAQIEFSPGVNLLYGKNAAGKTNLLEAIFFLSTGRSFRTSRLDELILQGERYFYLEATFVKDGIQQTLKISYDGAVRQLQLNATTYRNFTQLLGLLPHVLYTPEDIDLIRGGPNERRRFLDLHLAQIDPLYVHHWLRYNRAMKQRNCLLRTHEEGGIESWEAIMALSGAYIIQKREQAVAELIPYVERALKRFSADQELLSIHYRPVGIGAKYHRDEYAERLRKNLAFLRKKEAALGATLTGPHRDDLKLEVSGKDARAFASEGQKRSCIAAMRLGQWERYRAVNEVSPLFSIDDFGVHLDAQRHALLNAELARLGQVFLTSPFDSHDISAPLLAKFRIEEGTIL